MFLTVALFGYAAADTRSRFSHGKVEKGERHIPTTWNACLYRTKWGLPKLECSQELWVQALKIQYGNGAAVVVRARENLVHGEGRQEIHQY